MFKLIEKNKYIYSFIDMFVLNYFEFWKIILINMKYNFFG